MELCKNEYERGWNEEELETPAYLKYSVHKTLCSDPVYSTELDNMQNCNAIDYNNYNNTCNVWL